MPARHELLLTAGVAVVVLAAAAHGGSPESRLVAAVVGLGLLAVARRRPGGLLLVAVLVVPLSPVLPAALLRAGVPLAVVSQYGYAKDLVATGLVLAVLGETAAASAPHRARALDAVERWAAAYLGVVTLYLVLPVASPGHVAPPFDVRLLAWRYASEWVVLLLAVRRVHIGPRDRGRVLAAVGVLAALEAAACVTERLASTAWQRFLVSGIDVPRYLATTSSTRNLTDLQVHNQFAGLSVVRAEGPALDSLVTGAVCIVLVGTLAPTLVATRLSPRRGLLLAAASVAVVFTLTRSAVVGCIVAVALVLAPRRGVLATARARGTVIVAVLALAAAPVVVGGTFATRLASAFNGSDPSAAQHRSATADALSAATHDLLGSGLGTGPAVGYRFSTAVVTAENAYVQIALEIGVLGLVAFVGLLVALLREARRRTAAGTDSGAALGVQAVLAGLLVMSFFLDPWIDFGTLFLIATVAGLGTSDPAPAHRELPARELLSL